MTIAAPTWRPFGPGAPLGPQLPTQYAPAQAQPAPLGDTTNLQPSLVSALHALAALALTNGISFRIESGWRSTERQAQLYANRASNPYPVAPPGSSLHEYGAAVDLRITGQHGYSSAAAALAFLGGMLAPRVGLRWDASDAVHFALPWTLAEARARWNGGAQPLPTVTVTERAPRNFLWLLVAAAAVALAGD